MHTDSLYIENERQNLQERIKLVFGQHGLSIIDFSVVTSTESHQVYRMLKPGGKPSLELLLDILTVFPRLNPHWLYTGQGPQFLIDVSVVQDAKALIAQAHRESTESDGNLDKGLDFLWVKAIEHLKEVLSLSQTIKESGQNYFKEQREDGQQ